MRFTKKKFKVTTFRPLNACSLISGDFYFGRRCTEPEQYRHGRQLSWINRLDVGRENKLNQL